MKKTSKYLNKEFDNGWVCTHVGYANIQGKQAKYSGHINYYYVFTRKTSDGKCLKTIILNSVYAAKVYDGRMTVEAYAKRFQSKKSNKYSQIVNYQFL